MIQRRISFTGSLTGDLSVTGTSDLQGAVSDSNSDLTFADNIIVTGTSDLRGNVANSTGDLTVADNLVVTGTLTSQGAATLDDVYPETDLTDHLGSSTLTWLDLYVKYIYDQNGSGRLELQPTDHTAIYGASVNAASQYGVKIGNQNTLTAGTDRDIVGFYNDSGATLKSHITTDGSYVTTTGSLSGATIAATNGGLSTSTGNVAKGGAAGPIYIQGAATNNGSAVGVDITNQVTLNTAGGSIARFTPDNTVTTKSRVDINGFYLQPAQTVSTGGTYTLTPTSNRILLDPSSNATVTMGETGMQEGTVIHIINISASNTAAFSDTGGVSELNAAYTMGQHDTLTLVYANSAWYELARSVN